MALHDRILGIVEEFGVDYFRKGLKEIIERERRVLIQRITTVFHLNTQVFQKPITPLN